MDARTMQLTSSRNSFGDEAGDLDGKPTGADPTIIAMECIDHTRRSVRMKGVNMAMIVEPEMQPSLIGNSGFLWQLLMILLEAAVMSPAKGAVELRLSSVANGSVLRLEISCTDLNKAGKQHRHLFPRLRRAVTSEREYLGFDLALAARIARLMGGRFGRQGNVGSGGVMFWAELPLITKNASPSPNLPPVVDTLTKNQHNSEVLYLLVVDDDVMQREFLENVLSNAGHKVICVCSGREAIAAITNGNFSAVLMDIRMPQMDGVEATRVIRSFKGNKFLPILAVTAQDDQEHIERCFTAGMDGHLTKPVNPETLPTTIIHLILAKRAQKGCRNWQGSLAKFQPPRATYAIH